VESSLRSITAEVGAVHSRFEQILDLYDVNIIFLVWQSCFLHLFRLLYLLVAMAMKAQLFYLTVSFYLVFCLSIAFGSDLASEDEFFSVDDDHDQETLLSSEVNSTHALSKKNVVANKSDDDAIKQVNPDYKENSLEAGDHEMLEESAASGETKSAIASALRSPRGWGRNVTLFMKRNRWKITVLLIVISFRRELRHWIWNAISHPIVDPKTGRYAGRKLQPLDPLSIFKLLLFLRIISHMQALGDNNTSGESSPMSPTLLLLSRFSGSGGVAAWLLSHLLTSGNTAYLPPITQHYTFERVNHRYTKDVLAYSKALDERITPSILEQLIHHRETANVTSQQGGTHRIYEKLFSPVEMKKQNLYNHTIILMDWTSLDSSLSQLDTLRDEVSFLIQCQQERGNDNTAEVVVLLESPGGSAAEYALAAQQIIRLRRAGLTVTICVDKVAASGGYMMACTSTPGRLFAAPFAVLGSIGVIGQSVNIHKLLEGWGIKPLVFRGGKDKAPVGLIGEVTKTGLEKVQIMVDDIHRAFKRHVVENRPIMAERMEELSTGDIWLGYDALEVGLIDRIVTSDEYLGERILQDGARVLKLQKIVRGRSLFSRTPTVASADARHFDIPERKRWPVGDVMSSLPSFLERLQSVLSAFLLEDSPIVPRSARIRDVQVSSAS
jgi:signal peptide peptidase SppA